jgi:hypothetical protein
VWPAATRVRRTLETWSPREVCARGGALAGGSVVARWRQAVAGEHRWGPGEAPGKKSGDGQAMVWRWKATGAAVFNSGGVALVVAGMCGGVLQYRCGRGREI